jgi:hypothetical protein
VVLYEIGYEWGDSGNSQAADVRVTGLAPGAHALMWRDDSNGAELRMDLSLRVKVRGREVRMQFQFPKLHLQRNPQLVDSLGMPGWQVAAEGRDGRIKPRGGAAPAVTAHSVPLAVILVLPLSMCLTKYGGSGFEEMVVQRSGATASMPPPPGTVGKCFRSYPISGFLALSARRA